MKFLPIRRSFLETVGAMLGILSPAKTHKPVPPDRPPRGYRRKTAWGRLPKSTRRKQKDAILIRDGYRCQYCGRNMLVDVDSFLLISIDHIQPMTSGGKHGPDNMVTACIPCNVLKFTTHASTVEEGRVIIERRRSERDADRKRAVATLIAGGAL